MTVGLGAGVSLGLATSLTQWPVLVALVGWLRPFGTLFLNLLSIVVIPLVATALFVGVAGLGDLRRVGRLGVRTLGFFGAAALAAIAIGFLMAFSTTSSLATLPVMLDAAENDLRTSRTVAGFVLPVGASIGRAGSAVFQTVAVLFMARLYGVELGILGGAQAGAAVFLTSLTVASVPSASIVSLAPAFATTGLPLAGLTLLLGLDRIPDMFRTMTNVVGELTGAVVVAAAEGERLE